jgi:hypothetical protein
MSPTSTSHRAIHFDKETIKVVHFFLSILREQDNLHMINWAMVTTMALQFKGVDATCYRKTLGRASTADLNVAITKLDEIFTATSEH